MKLSGGKIALIVVGVLLIILVIGGVGTYNSLATAKTKVEEKNSDIGTQLQRRMDLIPNLVETVKGYAAHEQTAIDTVTEARSKLAGATTPSDKYDANQELSSALSKLLVVVENYPDLKASANFINLQDELAGTENRIANARTEYNDAVKNFNASIVKFPSNLIAGIFGFQKAEFFQASAGSEVVPPVSFK